MTKQTKTGYLIGLNSQVGKSTWIVPGSTQPNSPPLIRQRQTNTLTSFYMGSEEQAQVLLFAR